MAKSFKLRTIPQLNEDVPEEHYGSVSDEDKSLKKPRGFFAFPDEIKGKTDHGKNKFLIFYFEEDEDYEFVLSILKRERACRTVQPFTNSEKLVRILREYVAVDDDGGGADE